MYNYVRTPRPSPPTQIIRLYEYPATFNAEGIPHTNMIALQTNGTDDYWTQRVVNILNATNIYFDPGHNNIMYEVACEPYGKCDIDQRSFKAYLARWLTVH